MEVKNFLGAPLQVLWKYSGKQFSCFGCLQSNKENLADLIMLQKQLSKADLVL